MICLNSSIFHRDELEVIWYQCGWEAWLPRNLLDQMSRRKIWQHHRRHSDLDIKTIKNSTDLKA